jgi:HSP20 family molecular chaperone IbpA
MVKTIVFDNYDEAEVKSTLAVMRQWPGAGPSEISVKIAGKQFVISGGTEAPSVDAYMKNMLDQANAIQAALTKKK